MHRCDQGCHKFPETVTGRRLNQATNFMLLETNRFNKHDFIENQAELEFTDDSESINWMRIKMHNGQNT